jgi:hypothetical protein
VRVPGHIENERLAQERLAAHEGQHAAAQ